ncbi:glycosyltransferase family 4 protein [Marinobacterium sp. AK62]|uniref:Glycosyltransferase family 4 protein n=1 Tax=Marinobacterium alkalitolerans TaxID=1542925 RepID=A0ABS3ZDD0_9GAMM|nr:glycosyltransferase family 1 protein [Marinobacterium alkalitolerans]MBP0049713.1 glycosyltransferase family 4 protein [Marinobacterium alkalitolerans]
MASGRRGDGIAAYTSNLLDALEQLAEVRPYLFRGEHLEGRDYVSGPSFSVHVVRSQLGLNSFAADLLNGMSLLHCTDHRIPRVRQLPLVATIFDAVPFHHPEWARSRLRRVKNCLMRRSGRWPDRVICGSAFAAEEVSYYWHVPADDIRVVPLAVDAARFDMAPASAAEIRQALGLPEQYYLFVGTLQPRKNLLRLLSAHRQLPSRDRQARPLVIVGGDGWLDVRSRHELEADPGVMRLGFLSQSSLDAVYMGALALVVPSLHEGFGLPVLEGFAAGVPVLCSNTTSLPEVAGSGALLFDPLCVDSIYSALQSVRDDRTRLELVRAGYQVLQSYSWGQTAQQTLAVYRELL